MDQRPVYAVAYFFEDGALVPEFRTIDPRAPIRSLVAVLGGGSEGQGRATFVPLSAGEARPAEGGERMLLRLPKSFWAMRPARVYRAAAQMVYSLGSLEEGRAVTLLRGLRFGRIASPKGRRLGQPLERADFRPVRPWIQVIQPVAGAIVADPIPIHLSMRNEAHGRARLVVEDRVVAMLSLRNGRGSLPVPDLDDRDAVIRLYDGSGHAVDVPVMLRPD